VAGLRRDGYAFNVASNIATNSGQASAQITAPKLAVILGPWSKTEFFANYRQSFHSNDARGITLTVTPKEVLPIASVTPPAKTRGSEVGLRTQLVDGLQSFLALWRLDIASELVFSCDAGDTSPSRPSRRVGVEWNNHYVANKWLLLDADLSVSRARYTQADPAGNFIPGAVNRVASLGVAVTDFHQWFGSWQWRYFGPRPLVEDNSVKSAGTLLTNLRLGYRFIAHTRLVADIFNLLERKASDIDYYYTSRLKSEATAQDGIVFHPVEPRTLRVSLIHHF
jgi:outer membrane receptor protein involved in Fe transport